MPNDYTSWPILSNVQARLTAANIVLRTPADTDRQQAAMDAVVAEVLRRTQRQFQPGVTDEVRYYDGSGSPEQEVDEMISLSSVFIVAYDQQPVFELTDALLTFEQGKPKTRITVSRGTITTYAGGSLLPYAWHFPAGRQNVQVTGQFGFAPTIPSDLWEAVCGEMATRLAREATFFQAGQVNFNKAGDEEQRFAIKSVDTVWHGEFEAMIAFYKRRMGRKLRGLRNPML